MAALVEPAPALSELELLDLRLVRSEELDALLHEESIAWRDTLDWDFENSAALVRRFVELHALNGFALAHDREVVGYCYYVIEESKGLVGDLYVRRQFRNPAAEHRLLSGVLNELTSAGYVRRIEGQLMMLSYQAEVASRYLSAYPRDYLSLALPPQPYLAARSLASRFLIGPWQDYHQEEAAQLIATAYQSHVDSQINDQYRSAAGARRFLYNIVQYPGCGTFFPPASLTAFNQERGALCGICLSSIVGEASGHITQVCVGREFQGEGLGYEMLRRSLDLLHRHGCQKVSLTVTSANGQALRLYERMGFRRARHFAAYVWEGF